MGEGRPSAGIRYKQTELLHDIIRHDEAGGSEGTAGQDRHPLFAGSRDSSKTSAAVPHILETKKHTLVGTLSR